MANFRRSRRPLAVILILAGAFAVVVLMTRITPPLPWSTGAQAALDRYLANHTYRILSVEPETDPATVAGFCNVLDLTQLSKMWCVQVEGGLSFATHFLLHDNPDGWTVIPVFAFDQQIFADAGCSNW